MQQKESPEKVAPGAKLVPVGVRGGGWPDKNNNNGQVPTTSWKFEVDPLYRCNVCGRGFYTSPLYIHHVGNVHTTPRALAEAAAAATASSSVQIDTAQIAPKGPPLSPTPASGTSSSNELPSSTPVVEQATTPASKSDDEE